MKKYLLLSILFICFLFPSKTLVYASIPMNSYGLNVGDEFEIRDFYPYDFYVNGHLDFYLDNGAGGKGKYLGRMVSLQHTITHQMGRTFAHSSTYYRWGDAMGGNPSYVRDNVKESVLKRESDDKKFIRAHSRQLAEESGALIKVLDNYSWARITPTSFPTGRLSSPSVVNLNEEFTIELDAKEYYPYRKDKIRWELWFDNRWYVDGGTVNSDEINNLKIPLKLNGKGQREMEIRLFDEVERKTSIKKDIFVNQSPTADFSPSPNPSTRLKDVRFTDKSSDPEGDTLTYHYQTRLKGTSEWEELSTNANPSHTFNEIGTWEVKLTVTDEYNGSDSIVKDVTVENIKPGVKVSYSPSTIYEGDSVTITMDPTDDEDDTLSVSLSMKKGNNSPKTIFSQNNVKSGESLKHTINNIDLADYSFTVTVTDEHGGSVNEKLSFSVNPLEVKGLVEHTPNWKKTHEDNGHEPHFFYSGERFMLSAIVTDHPVDQVKVQFVGYQENDNLKNITLPLKDRITSGRKQVYTGELYEEWMSDPSTKIRNGEAHFIFTTEWKNGVTKVDRVTIQIIDGVYEAFEFFRSS